jgi:hypothetical protein
MTQKNNRDTIIEEIHRTRELIAAKFGGDIVAILEDARKRQAESGRAIWQGTSMDEGQSTLPDNSPLQPT